jgi:hypothetical protein
MLSSINILSILNHKEIRSRSMAKIYHANSNHKRAGDNVFTSKVNEMILMHSQK